MLRLNSFRLGCQAEEPCGRSVTFLPDHLANDEPMLRPLAVRWQDQLWHGNLEQMEVQSLMILDNAEIRGHPEALMFARLLVAETYRAQGKLELAEQIWSRLYDTIIELRHDLREFAQMIVFGLGRLAYEKHDAKLLEWAVNEIWDQAPDRIEGCICTYWIRRNFLAGLLELQKGAYGSAASRFQRMSESTGSLYERQTARLGALEALALQREGRSILARELMDNLSGHIDRGQVEGVFANHAGLFPNALSIADSMHYSTRTAIGRIVNFPTSHLRDPDPDIIIQAFGPGQIWIKHQEVILEVPLERILVAFLALHPEGVDVETLRRDLWPESPSRDVVHRNVKKLADKLGHNVLLHEQGVYHFGLEVRCDTLQYDELYERALMLPYDPDRYPALQAASRLQQKPFLQGITRHVWVEQQRIYYERHQGLVYYQMAGLCFRNQDPLQASDLLHQALQVNPIFDVAVNDYLRLLEWSGEHAQALRLYQLYEKRIKQLFDCPPGHDLQDLFQRLRNAVQVSGAFSEGALARAGVAIKRTMPRLDAADSDKIVALEKFFQTPR